MAKLGIQGIVFGKRNGEDFGGVLKDVAAAGYDGIELGVMTDRMPADILLAQLGENNLVCCGCHTGYDAFTDHDLLRRTAAHMNELGAKYLMCSGIPGWGNATRENYEEAARTFDQAGKLLAAHGVMFCYHNHNWEFFTLCGETRGMEVLLENTDPANVKLCVDVYWVAVGDDDPAQFIQKHAERCVYFHFKDGTFDASAKQPTTFTELGNGNVNLAAAWEAAQALAPEWVVTEQDKTDKEPAESARISAEYARQTLGI